MFCLDVCVFVNSSDMTYYSVSCGMLNVNSVNQSINAEDAGIREFWHKDCNTSLRSPLVVEEWIQLGYQCLWVFCHWWL